MTRAELAALVGAMDLDPLESTHIISPGYEHLANLTERIVGGRARAVAMIPIPWADGIAAAMNAIPKLLAVCEAAERLHNECCDLPHGKRLNVGPMLEPSEAAVLELRAALRDLEGE